MLKRSIVFSLVSIGFVGYFIFHASVKVATGSAKSSDSTFVSQTIGVQQIQATPTLISANQIIPMIKKYRFIVSPF